MGLYVQIRLQQEGQASRERLTRKWRMLSYPLSYASRARVYPSDYVFFAVTSVTRGEERDGKRQKVGSGRQWKTCILGTHNEQNKDCDRDCLSKSTKHQMQQSELQLITSNCDRCDSKKHKTPGIYARTRACVWVEWMMSFTFSNSVIASSRARAYLHHLFFERCCFIWKKHGTFSRKRGTFSRKRGTFSKKQGTYLRKQGTFFWKTM